MTADSRYRVMHKFWLDVTRDDEDHLDEYIHSLKLKRRFTQTVRDGLRLIRSLRNGDVSVLLELFPWITDRLAVQQLAQESEGERSIRLQLERIEQLIGQAGTVTALATVSSGTGLDLADLPSAFAARDEQPIEVTAAEARENFSAGMGDLFGDDDDDSLWDD